MNRKIFIIFVLLFLISSILFFANTASAAGLVPCGGTGQDPCTPCFIWVLLDKIINLMLYLALPILIIVFVIGGFKFVIGSSDPKQIEEAKKLLSAGIIGIFIAFLGWLIVDTIVKTLAADGAFTPAWNQINECPAPTKPTAPTSVQSIVPIPGTFGTDADARKALTSGCSTFNTGATCVPVKPNVCTTMSQTNCTSLAGIPKSTVDNLQKLQTICSGNSNCRFTVTGGTEAGHQTHAPGEPIVDIAPEKGNPTTGDYTNLRATILSNFRNATAVCEKGNKEVLGCIGADHIHVKFPR